MTNSQSRLIALPVFTTAASILATQSRDGGMRLIGGVLVLIGIIIFGIELWKSYDEKTKTDGRPEQ